MAECVQIVSDGTEGGMHTLYCWVACTGCTALCESQMTIDVRNAYTAYTALCESQMTIDVRNAYNAYTALSETQTPR